MEISNEPVHTVGLTVSLLYISIYLSHITGNCSLTIHKMDESEQRPASIDNSIYTMSDEVRWTHSSGYTCLKVSKKLTASDL